MHRTNPSSIVSDLVAGLRVANGMSFASNRPAVLLNGLDALDGALGTMTQQSLVDQVYQIDLTDGVLPHDLGDDPSHLPEFVLHSKVEREAPSLEGDEDRTGGLRVSSTTVTGKHQENAYLFDLEGHPRVREEETAEKIPGVADGSDHDEAVLKAVKYIARVSKLGIILTDVLGTLDDHEMNGLLAIVATDGDDMTSALLVAELHGATDREGD